MGKRGSASASRALQPEPKKARTNASQQMAAQESPGRLDDLSTFLDTGRGEHKAAAYLGCDNLMQLRRLVVSWPVLKAYLKYQKISDGLRKNGAMELIRDAEDEYTNVDPDVSFPLDESDGRKKFMKTKSMHLAVLLLTLEQDLRAFRSYPEGNAEKNQIYREQFRQALRCSIPDGDFPTCAPDIASWENETRLEPINRCWSLLQFMRNTIQDDLWGKKFSDVGLNKPNLRVRSSYVPEWMRDKKEATTDTQPAPEEEEPDDVRPISVEIRWERVPGDAGLNALLENARAHGIEIPHHGGLQMDPCLHVSLLSFKDEIYRRFKCSDIQMDIKELKLEYGGDFIGRIRKDLLTEPWHQTLEVLHNEKNGDFIITVIFEPFQPIDPRLAMGSLS